MRTMFSKAVDQALNTVDNDQVVNDAVEFWCKAIDVFMAAHSRGVIQFQLDGLTTLATEVRVDQLKVYQSLSNDAARDVKSLRADASAQLTAWFVANELKGPSDKLQETQDSFRDSIRELECNAEESIVILAKVKEIEEQLTLLFKAK